MKIKDWATSHISYIYLASAMLHLALSETKNTGDCVSHFALSCLDLSGKSGVEVVLCSKEETV